MNVLISGGCKNGKSFYAQELALNLALERKVELYYVATMKPVDGEDRARILRHQEERDGWGFTTLEWPDSLCRRLENSNSKGVFLMDSVTALLANEMFRSLKNDTDMSVAFDPQAAQRVADDVVSFAEKTGNTIFVSDWIYGDAGIYDRWTEAYRAGLAMIDRALARIADRVIEVSYGTVIDYKW